MIVLATRLIVDWRDIGVTAVRVATPGEADAVLIDEVAPNASANWYLTRIGCAYGLACDPRAEAAVIAARAAPSLAARSEALAQADTFAARNGGYIALGQPQRWSLVAPALIGYRDNAFGTHPLRSLRNPG
jgi:oligopeptide transport system substrate-binding protein